MFGVSFWIGGHTASASSFSIESVGSSIGLGNADLRTVIVNVIRWVLGFVTLVAVGYMIYGGYFWLTAAGNEQRVEKAKQVILQAAIGLVIMLMAWAIVLFVARTTGDLTNGSNTNGGDTGGCPLCGSTSTFDLTAITSCAVAPNFAEDVPRSSAVSLTFNTDVTGASVNAAVNASGTDPKLMIQYCGDDATCASPTTPKPLENQVYSGSSPTGAAGSPKEEWVANGNTVTFYHTSFSTNESDPDNLYFEAGKYYRLMIPRATSNTGLKDILNRTLQNCGDGLNPIPGDHCDTTSDPNVIYWTFQTGSDVAGPPLQVSGTTPTSAYIANTSARPDRNVPRNAALNVTFNNAVDPASVTTANFQVYKFTNPPNATTGTGGTTEAAPLDPASFDIRVSPDGNGAWIQLHDTLFDSFTWYKVVVEHFRNLCATEMDGQYSWVFETSDVAPGVSQVYPTDNFQYACPTTKVFIQYNTSMWRVGSGSYDCSPSAAGSYVTNGAMNPTPAGRTFDVQDPWDAANQYNTCKIYAFTPETAGLVPDTTYHVGVSSDLSIDVSGTHLNYGDTPPANVPSQGPWSFHVADPNSPTGCYQPPVITSVQPAQGQDGQCVSVIGDYFLRPGTLVPGSGDGITLGGRAQTVPGGAWNQQSIVSSVDAGPDPGGLARDATHNYQVTVDYGGTIGALTSAVTTSSRFRLNSGSDAGGVCLYSLNPNQGQVGTTLAASGKGFAPYTAGQSRVVVSPTAPNWPVSSPSSNWTDTSIAGISVGTGTSSGVHMVQIQRDSAHVSNALPFTVSPPVTGTPSVVEDTACNIATNTIPSPNPIRGDTQVCKNALASARFTLPMDGTTLNQGTIILNSCTDPSTCTGTLPYTVAQAGTDGFTVTPTGGFTRDTRYQVTITTGVHASLAAGGKALAAPYTWQFVTADTDADCPVAGVAITPAGPLIERTTPFTEPLTAGLVDLSCRLLNPGSTQFTWGITNPPHVADLQSGNTSQNNVATNPASGPEVGTARMTVAAATKTSAPVDITYNPTRCTTSADCRVNQFGEQCTADGTTYSQCVNNQCTPVVTGMDPDAGAIGTWTTIKGCWFGGYQTGTSKVTFSTNKDADIPSTTICGPASNTWTNERIVREVPHVDTPTNDPSNDAITGPVTVTRSDGQTATSAGDFTVNTTVHPGLCRVVPNNGLSGDAITLNGIRFGSDEPTKRTAIDNVNITKIATPPASPVLMSTYTSWSDSGTQATIVTAVPTTAAVGESELRVRNENQVSNPWPFTVNDPNAGGTGSCPAGQQCFTDNAANCTALGLGCGLAIQCCAAVPTIVSGSWQPPQNSTNICRNTATQVTFSQPLDSLTVNQQTMRYLDGASVKSGSVGLSTTGGQSTITYAPGLLSASNAQQWQFTSRTSTPITLDNPSFDTADASGVPVQWPGPINAHQSTDLPPGHSGHSVLADCSAGGCSDAYIAQNLPNTNVINSTYRVTGWVKVTGTPTSAIRGGLITRCSTGSSCGYDLFNAAPGVFLGQQSNGWTKIDFVVTKTIPGGDLLSLDCFAKPGTKTWCDDITITQETTGGTLLRSTSGVLADITGSPLRYTTSANICTLDHVSIDAPTSLLLTSLDSANPASQGTFRAWAYPAGSQTPLQNLPGTYAWTWDWTSAAAGVATVTIAGANNQASTSSNVQAVSHGQTTAQVKARVTENAIDSNDHSERTAQGDINVQACDHPWIFNDATDGACDLNPGQCGRYNFQLFYCQGNNSDATLLPDFSYRVVQGVSTQDATQLKSYFFKENQTSHDVIGLLIFKNDQLLSPYDWFIQRFPLQTGASSTTINGYPAVKTGTTTYVGVTNNTGSSLQGLMFVIDYNSNNASATTKTIYDQLITNLIFNVNANSTVRQQIINDTKRGQDLASIGLSLEAYKQLHGTYPTLTSGTYLNGYSTSVWPSWQQTFGQTINKSLPTDPTNALGAPTGTICSAASNYDPKTCWSEPLHQFQCPADSHIYAYTVSADGLHYSLYAHMEYTGAGNFANNPTVSCPANSSCSCFNYQVTSP